VGAGAAAGADGKAAANARIKADAAVRTIPCGLRIFESPIVVAVSFDHRLQQGNQGETFTQTVLVLSQVAPVEVSI
jgi:hypothetical protein